VNQKQSEVSAPQTSKPKSSRAVRFKRIPKQKKKTLKTIHGGGCCGGGTSCGLRTAADGFLTYGCWSCILCRNSPGVGRVTRILKAKLKSEGYTYVSHNPALNTVTVEVDNE